MLNPFKFNRILISNVWTGLFQIVRPKQAQSLQIKKAKKAFLRKFGFENGI